MSVLVVLLAACAPPSAATRTITRTNHVENVVTVDPCDARWPGAICTVVGIAGLAAFADEGLPGPESPLYFPMDAAYDPTSGALYVLDWNNHRIRELLPDGTVVNVAGNGFVGDGIFDDGTGTWHDGPADEFAFDHPSGLAVAPGGDLYVAAFHNSRVDQYFSATQEVRYLAGTGERAYAGDGGPALDAVFDLVPAVALGDDGTLYASDQGNAVIRAITADGAISLLAGTPGVSGYEGDGGPASEALFGANSSAVDPSNRIAFYEGDLYLADTENDAIRRIDLDSGVVDTVVGPDAGLAGPRDVALGPDGTLYIADTDNHCVRAVAGGEVATFAGQCGVPTAPGADPGDGVDAGDATLRSPYGVEVDPAGDVYIADTSNQIVRVVWK